MALDFGEGGCAARDGAPVGGIEHEILFVQLASVAEDDCSLDDILEFAHIARPLVRQQHLHRFWVDALDGAFVGLCCTAHKIRSQQGNVLPSLAQRRKVYLNHVQSKIKILAEPPRFHFRLHITIRRGDDADVSRPVSRIADSPVFFFLKQAKDLRLKQNREVGDFVKKQGPSFCRLHQPFFI